MKNLDQKTYDRIIDRLRGRNDRFPRTITPKDAADLLLAYEGAVTLLEGMVACRDGRLTGKTGVREFIFDRSGEPRVELDTDEESTHSARGLLRPAEVDSEDY